MIPYTHHHLQLRRGDVLIIHQIYIYICIYVRILRININDIYIYDINIYIYDINIYIYI